MNALSAFRTGKEDLITSREVTCSMKKALVILLNYSICRGPKRKHFKPFFVSLRIYSGLLLERCFFSFQSSLPPRIENRSSDA